MEAIRFSETTYLTTPTHGSISKKTAFFMSEVILNLLPRRKGRVITSAVQERIAKLFVKLENWRWPF
jgi:hypothetical protein